MLAFFLTIALFVFFFMLGYSTLSLLHDESDLLQDMLLAPGIGIAVVVIPVLLLNWIGLPVIRFARILTVALLVVAVAVYINLNDSKKLNRTALSSYLPFMAILLVGLFLIGYPMLHHGFYWMSYCNDDMANYCLSADRFLNHGYLDIPDIALMAYGQDYTLQYYVLTVLTMSRSGWDLTLAWISGLTGLDVYQAYMPVIVALHVSLISVASVFLLKINRILSICFCCFMAISSILGLGTIYQLGPQVGGTAMMCVSSILVMRDFNFNSIKQVMKHAFLIAIAMVAFLSYYLELFPFFALSVGLYYMIKLIKGWRINKYFSMLFFSSITFICVIMNKYLVYVMGFLFFQVGVGTSTDGEALSRAASIFPYYLIPSGVPTFFGLAPIVPWSNNNLVTVLIIVGFLLFIFLFISSSYLSMKEQPFACISMVMILMTIYLLVNQLAYGLYKIAMFIQPFAYSAMFLMGYLLLFKENRLRKGNLFTVGAAIFMTTVFIFNFVMQAKVVKDSFSYSTKVEVPFASDIKITKLMADEVGKIDKKIPLLSDSSNFVFNKFLMLYSKTISTFAVDGQIFNRIGTVDDIYPSADVDTGIHDGKFIRIDNNKEIQSDEFVYSDSGHFDVNHTGKKNVLISGNKINLYNRSNVISKNIETISILDSKQIYNWLMFIQSELSSHYFGGTDNSNTSIWQLEKDVYYPDKTFAGVGKNFLFNILNFKDNSRLVVEFTSTLNRDMANKVPDISLYDEDKATISGMGRGSARLFSAAVIPQKIGDGDYIELEIEAEPKKFPYKKNFIMNLYGKDIQIDQRRIVGFIRDISLITEEEYENLDAPAYLSRFPENLANKNLEYSGIYEDGWASEAMFFGLKQKSEHTKFLVKGSVPLIADANFQTELSVLMDGKEILNESLGFGNFEVECAIASGEGRKRIELVFSDVQRLPAGDDRITSAKLEFLGFAE